MESIFIYFNTYDSMTRKSTVMCLERVRYYDYKLKERKKLAEIKQRKEERVLEIESLLEERKGKI